MITALYESGVTVDYPIYGYYLPDIYKQFIEDVNEAHEAEDKLQNIEVTLLFDAKQLF